MLKFVDDYHNVKQVLERSIMIFYKTMVIDERQYNSKLKGMMEWCEEQANMFINEGDNSEDKFNRIALIDSLLHINTDRSQQNQESLDLGLGIFNTNKDFIEKKIEGMAEEASKMDTVKNQLYNYHGGVNSNLLKQNKDLKEHIEDYLFQLEYKNSCIQEWSEKCWLKNMTISVEIVSLITHKP